jgi:hypothetical protein
VNRRGFLGWMAALIPAPLLAKVALSWGVSRAQSTIYRWTGAARDARFDNPENWEPNGVPYCGDKVSFAYDPACHYRLHGETEDCSEEAIREVRRIVFDIA